MSTKAPPFLSFADVANRARLGSLIEEMRGALADGSRARAQVPERSLVWRREPLAVFGTMPAHSAAHGLFVTKVAAFVEGQTPSVSSLVLALSSETGRPLAVLDGAAVTNLKCAAVTAVVTDACAPLEARSMALIGTGVQAREQVRAVTAVRRIEEIRVHSRDHRHVARFIDEVAPALGGGVRLRPARSAEEAIEGADIVSTATTSAEPLFSTERLAAPVHVNVMGAHTTSAREVAADLLQSALLIVEDRPTAVAEAGAVHERAIDLEQLLAAPASSLRSVRTVFSSVGHAFLDLLAVAHVLAVGARFASKDSNGDDVT